MFSKSRADLRHRCPRGTVCRRHPPADAGVSADLPARLPTLDGNGGRRILETNSAEICHIQPLRDSHIFNRLGVLGQRASHGNVDGKAQRRPQSLAPQAGPSSEGSPRPGDTSTVVQDPALALLVPSVRGPGQTDTAVVPCGAAPATLPRTGPQGAGQFPAFDDRVSRSIPAASV